MNQGVTPALEELDLRGLKCPLPAMKTEKRLKALEAGARLVVRATDPMSVIDIPHAVARLGGRVLSSGSEGRTFTFLIER